jgi:polyphosphate:AMP phosphotransferase
MPALNDELLARQLDTRTLAKFSVAVIVTGVPSAGRSETVNKLIEWLDPKYVTVRAFGESDASSSHPPMWRYWRALPAFGRVAFYFWGWYGEYLGSALRDSRKAKRHAERELERIRQLETMLSADGVRVVKIHLDLDADTQRKRLKKLRGNKLTRWRVTHEDLWLARHHKAFRKAIGRCIAASDQPVARWHPIDGANEHYREVRVGELLRDEMQAGLGQARKAVRQRVSKTSKPPPLRRDRLRKVDDEDYDRELEQLQGKLALLTRRSKFRKHGLVLAFEGMDAAGKGGAIRRITHALDARQYQVLPVSAPTAEERLYPYLWRFWRDVPERGHIAIYDRSWYGRVLVERVEGLATREQWSRAYREINEFERMLSDDGARIVKIFLHISAEEQLKRFEQRLNDPLKRWKLTYEDFRNRDRRPDYETAVEEMVARTATQIAPWHVVPAEDKKFARIEALELITGVLAKGVDLSPQPLDEEAKALARALFGALPRDM